MLSYAEHGKFRAETQGREPGAQEKAARAVCSEFSAAVRRKQVDHGARGGAMGSIRTAGLPAPAGACGELPG
jgi:hypothetical protein